MKNDFVVIFHLLLLEVKPVTLASPFPREHITRSFKSYLRPFEFRISFEDGVDYLEFCHIVMEIRSFISGDFSFGLNRKMVCPYFTEIAKGNRLKATATVSLSRVTWGGGFPPLATKRMESFTTGWYD